MVAWKDYKQQARERGSLALELYVVISTPAKPPEIVKSFLAEHLAYQDQQEAAGALALAGPMSDLSGEHMQGEGLIVYRAGSLAAARDIAENDPMHSSGARTFTIRRWLLNEGTLKPEAD
ncbi:MAG: YciI family protein [Rhodobacteraceae bacterium]|nr:YciI family protein [Paracoccaceae bacterium]